MRKKAVSNDKKLNRLINRKNSLLSIIETVEAVEPETLTQTEVDDIEVWDYDQLRDDYRIFAL